jgi:uncharacterized membrane protein YgdD (TMEM256/DUF423 family)
MNGLARTAIQIGAIFGALSVTAGAFGAHALRSHVEASRLLVWNTAAQYQMYHALALVLVAVVAQRTSPVTPGPLKAATICFTAGTFIFSGTLYTLVLTDLNWLGAITPIGGLLLIAGWLCLAGYAISRAAKDEPWA